MKPENVVGWHCAGFRLYWRWRSRPPGGRPKITDEIRSLIRQLATDNPDGGAPKIHGELLKLGFVVSERTVARCLRKSAIAFALTLTPNPHPQRLSPLRNVVHVADLVLATYSSNRVYANCRERRPRLNESSVRQQDGGTFIRSRRP